MRGDMNDLHVRLNGRDVIAEVKEREKTEENEQKDATAGGRRTSLTVTAEPLSHGQSRRVETDDRVETMLNGITIQKRYISFPHHIKRHENKLFSPGFSDDDGTVCFSFFEWFEKSERSRVDWNRSLKKTSQCRFFSSRATLAPLQCLEVHFRFLYCCLMLPFEFSYAFDSSKEEVCREIAASSATCCVSANEAAASF